MLITLCPAVVIPSECKAVDLSPVNVIVPLFTIFWLPPLCDIPVALLAVLRILPVVSFIIVASSARIPTEASPIFISP